MTMTPLRINFVLPALSMAGGFRVLAIYAERLAQRGHAVTVVSGSRAMPWDRRVKGLILGRGWHNVIPPDRSHFDHVTGIDHRIVRHARPIVDADVPDGDVVVASWWKTAYWVDNLSLSKGAKAYLVQHDERHVGGTHDEVVPTWHLPMHKVLVAQWLEPLLREHGVTDELTVVPNAVDAAQFRAPPRGKQAAPTVGMMYSDAHFKGADIALTAFVAAKREVPDLRLVAFGKEAELPGLPLPEGTVYHRDPPQDRLAGVYAACDAWLFASRCEGFGLPILEAMSCRTPVIATPAGAAPELVGGGGGVLVDAENADSMKRAIVDLTRLNGADWRAMSDRALATAAAFNWDAATDAFEAALHRTAHRGGTAPADAHPAATI